MINTEKVALAVGEVLNFRFGVGISAAPIGESSARDGEQNFKLSLEQSFGVLTMIIKSAEIHVRAAELPASSHGSVFWVRVSLHYNLVSGGRNASVICTLWLDKSYAVLASQTEEEAGRLVDDASEGAL